MGGALSDDCGRDELELCAGVADVGAVEGAEVESSADDGFAPVHPEPTARNSAPRRRTRRRGLLVWLGVDLTICTDAGAPFGYKQADAERLVTRRVAPLPR
jgi:hypothetical protein